MKGNLRDLTAAGNLMEEALRNPGLSPAARRAGEAAVGPKPDPLSPKERAEVERHLAEGKVQRCEPKACAVDPAKPQTVKEHRDRQARIARRQAKAARAKQRREEAAAAARVGRGAAPAPPEAERQPPPAAQPEAPALKPRRHGMLWWLCAEDGTRVSGPYGSRKVAEAALMEASDAP